MFNKYMILDFYKNEEIKGDLVLVIGNQETKQTFRAQWILQIHLTLQLNTNNIMSKIPDWHTRIYWYMF